MASIKEFIVEACYEAGFDRVGVCAASTAPELARFHAWLDAGYDGQMHYLQDRREAYSNPSAVLEGVRSIVMLALDYADAEPAMATASESNSADLGWGRVSRYAWGDSDYHDVIHKRLRRVRQQILEHHPNAKVRGVVDTAPLLERDYARLSGLGWIGKNTMLIDREAGSWFFLAALLTDLELTPDPPFATDHCGVCRACLDACPTDAFPAPYVLDATRCVSYLTIELRGPIPTPLRTGLGDWVFGCDVCQEVCPWNRKHPATSLDVFAPRPDLHPVELRSLFSLTDEAFRERFRQTPLWRSKREGLLRNAALVLGNQAHPDSLPALEAGLADPSDVVRASCAWALGRLLGEGVASARAGLTDRLGLESSEMVRQEIEAALSGQGSG